MVTAPMPGNAATAASRGDVPTLTPAGSIACGLPVAVGADARDQAAPQEISPDFRVWIDDHSRIAVSQVMPDEKEESAIAFLHAACR